MYSGMSDILNTDVTSVEPISRCACLYFSSKATLITFSNWNTDVIHKVIRTRSPLSKPSDVLRAVRSTYLICTVAISGHRPADTVSRTLKPCPRYSNLKVPSKVNFPMTRREIDVSVSNEPHFVEEYILKNSLCRVRPIFECDWWFQPLILSGSR